MDMSGIDSDLVRDLIHWHSSLIRANYGNLNLDRHVNHPGSMDVLGMAILEGNLNFNRGSIAKLSALLNARVSDDIDIDLREGFDNGNLSWTFVNFSSEAPNRFGLQNFFYANACRYWDVINSSKSTIGRILELLRENEPDDGIRDIENLDESRKVIDGITRSRQANVIYHGSVLDASDSLIQMRGITNLVPIMLRSIPYVSCLEISTRSSLDQLLEHDPYDVPERDLVSLRYREKVNLVRRVVEVLEGSGSGYVYDQFRFLLPACMPTSFCLSYGRKSYDHLLSVYGEGISRVRSPARRLRLESILRVLNKYTFKDHAMSKGKGERVPADLRYVLRDHYGLLTFPFYGSWVPFYGKIYSRNNFHVSCWGDERGMIEDRYLGILFDMMNRISDWREDFDAWPLWNLWNDNEAAGFLNNLRISVTLPISYGSARDLVTHRSIRSSVSIMHPSYPGRVEDREDLDSTRLNPVTRWIYGLHRKVNPELPSLAEFDGLYRDGFDNFIDSDNPEGKDDDIPVPVNDPTNIWALSFGSLVMLRMDLNPKNIGYLSALRIQPKAHPEYMAFVLFVCFIFQTYLNDVLSESRDLGRDLFGLPLFLKTVLSFLKNDGILDTVDLDYYHSYFVLQVEGWGTRPERSDTERWTHRCIAVIDLMILHLLSRIREVLDSSSRDGRPVKALREKLENLFLIHVYFDWYRGMFGGPSIDRRDHYNRKANLMDQDGNVSVKGSSGRYILESNMENMDDISADIRSMRDDFYTRTFISKDYGGKVTPRNDFLRRIWKDLDAGRYPVTEEEFLR